MRPGAGQEAWERRMAATLGWRADVSSLPGAGVRIGVSDGDRLVSVQSVLNALQTEPRVGSWFGACLAALPWRAFYWECPALNAVALRNAFECVAFKAPSLMGLTAEPDAFRAHLDAAPPGSLVAVFPNLSGDAVLVTPAGEMTRRDIRISPPFCAPRRKRKSRRSFRRWPLRRCAHAGKDPSGVSTAGDRVAWLHGRVDTWPKYYRHAPYRAARR